MQLPGLPTTKARIIERAASEGWPFEEQKARGGTRRLYEVPEKYLQGTSYAPSNVAKVVAGHVAAGSKDVNWDMMDMAMRALSEWERERGIKIEEGRRSAIISILYDYLIRGEPEELGRVFKALG